MTHTVTHTDRQTSYGAAYQHHWPLRSHASLLKSNLWPWMMSSDSDGVFHWQLPSYIWLAGLNDSEQGHCPLLVNKLYIILLWFQYYHGNSVFWLVFGNCLCASLFILLFRMCESSKNTFLEMHSGKGWCSEFTLKTEMLTVIDSASIGSMSKCPFYL